MSCEIETGTCDLCGESGALTRKYYSYDVNCECCSPNHFVIVRHCVECEPEEPKNTSIIFKTKNLKKLEK